MGTANTGMAGVSGAAPRAAPVIAILCAFCCLPPVFHYTEVTTECSTCSTVSSEGPDQQDLVSRRTPGPTASAECGSGPSLLLGTWRHVSPGSCFQPRPLRSSLETRCWARAPALPDAVSPPPQGSQGLRRWASAVSLLPAGPRVTWLPHSLCSQHFRGQGSSRVQSPFFPLV